MIVSRVILKNWRNFQKVDVALGARVFLVGPNASGKSNFLDVFRFLRDIAKREGGGLQQAVGLRKGISKVRCLAARRYPDVEIEVHLATSSGQEPAFRYAIGIRQEPRGQRRPMLRNEKAWVDKELVLDRPDARDRGDEELLTQTHLEQITTNAEFREIARFFESVQYLHILPQLIRNPETFSAKVIPTDPYGQAFLERVARTTEKTRAARLKKIEAALKKVVPQLKELAQVKDEIGVPHLEALYEHWRPHGAKQREDQFSDGTLRLIGLFWSLLDGESLLLLEEPELSLNGEIVRRLPSLMHKVQRQTGRQVLVSTHSTDLFLDKGIGSDEVLVLTPGPEGTIIEVASQISDVGMLIEGGLSVGEAVLPRTAPKEVNQLTLSL